MKAPCVKELKISFLENQLVFSIQESYSSSGSQQPNRLFQSLFFQKPEVQHLYDYKIFSHWNRFYHHQNFGIRV